MAFTEGVLIDNCFYGAAVRCMFDYVCGGAWVTQRRTIYCFRFSVRTPWWGLCFTVMRGGGGGGVVYMVYF